MTSSLTGGCVVTSFSMAKGATASLLMTWLTSVTASTSGTFVVVASTSSARVVSVQLKTRKVKVCFNGLYKESLTSIKGVQN